MSCSCNCSGSSCAGGCGCNCGRCGCTSSSAISANPIPAPPLSSGDVCQNACDTAVDPCCDPTCMALEDIDVITVPEVDASIQVSVCDSDQWPIGMCVTVVWTGGSATLRISAVDEDENLVTLTNDGWGLPGTVSTAQTQMFVSGVCPDTDSSPTDCCCLNLFVAEAFTAPSAISTALMNVSGCHSMVAGMRLRVDGLGCVEIVDVPDADTLEISVRNYEAGVTPGVTTVSEGGFIHPADTCIATDDTIDGDGSDADPFTVADLEVVYWRACYDADPGTTVTTCANAYDCNNDDTPAGQPLFTGPDVLPTPIPLAVAKEDPDSVVDLVNDGIVIPKDGTYHVDVYAQVHEGVTDGWYDLALGINDDQLIATDGIGVEIVAVDAPNSDEHVFEDVVVHISGTFRLSANDVLKAYLQYAGAAGPTQISATNGIESVMFTGHWVSK